MLIETKLISQRVVMLIETKFMNYKFLHMISQRALGSPVSARRRGVVLLLLYYS